MAGQVAGENHRPDGRQERGGDCSDGWKLIAEGKISGIRRGGYVVKRGRGRVIVELVPK